MGSNGHDRGLVADVATLLQRRGILTRRRALYLLGTASAGLLAACKAKTPNLGASSTSTSSPPPTASQACAEIPEETGGPFPGDGSNGPNVLNRSGIVRSDIRSSFGSSTRVATGIPLDIELSLLNAGAACAPYAGGAIYLWHCDIDGNYSLYSQAAANENYLRGVQAAGADGVVRFRSIFPAAYSGRWPHIHFEIYPSLAKAASVSNRIRTSQLAIPKAVCDTVYATSGYERSVREMSRLSLSSDLVFRDGYQSQLADVGGDVSSGLVAKLRVPVS